MKHTGVFATILTLHLVVGCAYIGNRAASSVAPSSPAPSIAVSAQPTTLPTGPAPIVSASAGATPDPTPIQSEPAPSATPSTTPEPPPLPPTPLESPPHASPAHEAGLAASDRFWNYWYDTCFFGVQPVSSSLAEITQASDLVIRGTIVDLYARRRQPFEPAYVKVSITEVLKGQPVYSEPDHVEIQIGIEPDNLADLRSSLPVHDHLWFVTYDEDHEGTYYTTDYTQVSVLREIGGDVEVILPDAIANAFSPEQFPVPLDGTSFEELVQRVRDLTAPGQGSMHALARRVPPNHDSIKRFDAC